MPDYTEAAKMYMENAALTYEAQVKVNNQLYMMEQMRNQVKKEDGTNQVLPANLLPDNENVAIQIGEYNKLQLQRNSMAENSSPRPCGSGSRKDLTPPAFPRIFWIWKPGTPRTGPTSPISTL